MVLPGLAPIVSSDFSGGVGGVVLLFRLIFEHATLLAGRVVLYFFWREIVPGQRLMAHVPLGIYRVIILRLVKLYYCFIRTWLSCVYVLNSCPRMVRAYRKP